MTSVGQSHNHLHHEMTPNDVEWRYEMRRECQEIIPNLFLGPLQTSRSLDILKGFSITHIVCIRDAAEAYSVRPRFPEHFRYLVLDVKDSEEQNLIRLFPGAKEFIDSALREDGRVLVHCNGGISLSPAFVVMYVMQYLNMTWEQALHYVQERRYCISPNGGFLSQIKEYESIYKATYAVTANPPRQVSVARRKRDENEEDEDSELRDEDRKRTIRPLRGDLAANPSTLPPQPDAMET